MKILGGWKSYRPTGQDAYFSNYGVRFVGRASFLALYRSRADVVPLGWSIMTSRGPLGAPERFLRQIAAWPLPYPAGMSR